MAFERLVRVSAVVAAALCVTATAGLAKDFTFSEKANARLAKKMSIPIFFTLPSSARLPLKGPFKTDAVLVDFKHPDAIKSGNDAGLRLFVTPRAGLADRIAKSGIFKTGDLLLAFRHDWGGAGAYPNVQMGISHAGLLTISGGKAQNLDNPLNEEYNGPGMRADFTSKSYRETFYIHVVRPRGLSDADRANIASWAGRFRSNAKKIYPAQMKFNDDYNAPKYKRGGSLDFVKRIGQLGLGKAPGGTIDMYCSEFAWSLLSLRGCDPAKSGAEFDKNGVPSCISPPMRPLDATGNNINRRNSSTTIGLADGPLTVIDGLKLSEPERVSLIKSVFTEDPKKLSKMSEGHRKVAAEMQPKFEKLEGYYLDLTSEGTFDKVKARLARAAFNSAIPDNYSPTSFLVNTLLPPDNENRTMDYVATIVIE